MTASTINCPQCRFEQMPETGAEMICSRCGSPFPASPPTMPLTMPLEATVNAEVPTFVGTSAPTAAGPISDALAPDGYELLAELGRGGMGIVYRARHVRLARTCALKMILAGGHAGEAERQRFENEAQTIARLQHPGIVQIFEVGEHQGHPFMALELCAGGSLDTQLRVKPPTAKEAAEIVRTLALAMQAAHDARVIHRDLKPANVLVASDGTLKITDFGLAKKLDEEGRTHTGSILGTPSYMPPEQAEGSKELGPTADVYALGAILYECLTGRPPFRGATAWDTLYQVLKGDPVAVRHLNPRVPIDLETICHKCLEKNPAKRYASARELAEDCTAFLEERPIRARPVRALERAWRWCRRYPAIASTSAAALLFLIVGLIGMTLLYVRAEDQRREADTARGFAESETLRANSERDLAQANAREADRQRKAARDQADRAGQVSRILTGMFAASDPLGLNGLAFGLSNRAGETLLARDLLERALALTQEDTGLAPGVRSEVYLALGNVYRGLGAYQNAEPLLRQALELRKKTAGTSTNDLAASVHALAWFHHERGDYQAAEAGYREALALREQADNRDETAILNTRFNLAWLLTEMGLAEQAEDLLKEVLAGRTRLFGEDHRETGLVRGTLAALYLDTDRPLDAMPLIARTLTTFEKIGVDRKFINAATLFQQAVVQEQLWGNTAKAVEQLREVVTLTRQAIGDRHLYVAIPLTQLGIMYEKSGRFDDALKAYTDALGIARDAVGLTHPKLLIIVERLAFLYRRSRENSRADALYDEVLKAKRERYGDKHPAVADTLVARAGHEFQTGNNAAEEKSLRMAAEIYRQAKRRPALLAARCLGSLGNNFCRKADYATAERYYREALAIERQLHTKPHTETLDALLNLVYALFKANKFASEGETFLQEVERLIPQVPTNQQRWYRHEWTLRSAELHCHRGEHLPAAELIDRYRTSAKLPAEYEEQAFAYVACLNTLKRDRATGDEKRRELQERYETAAVARLRQSWQAQPGSRPNWGTAPALAALRACPDFQKLLEEIRKAPPG